MSIKRISELTAIPTVDDTDILPIVDQTDVTTKKVTALQIKNYAINGGYLTTNDQVGTTYTLVPTDVGKVVTLNNASAITLTVPSGLSVGFNCVIVQLGAGQVTVTPSGATVNNRQSHTKIAGQFAVATIVSHITNAFIFSGDTAS